MNLFIGTIKENEAQLWQDEIHHCITVLRHKIGDEILVTNGNGLTIKGEISSISKNEVSVKVLEIVNLPSRISGLHIAIAPTKNLDRFEFFIEKAVELGVSEITPIVCFHSERKQFNFEKIDKKALMASKQALRANFIKIHPLTTFENFLNLHTGENIYLAHCHTDIERVDITHLPKTADSIVMIGPEGDFSKEEVEKGISVYNALSTSLGVNRLRTETAGIYSASYFYSQIK